MPVYRDPKFKSVSDVHLSNEAYREVLDKKVVACTDVIIVKRLRRCVYLAQRQRKPARGWWMIGGALHHDLTVRQSLEQHFEADTGRRLETSLLTSLGEPLEYLFGEREQSPRENGTHTVGLTYMYHPRAEELAQLIARPLTNQYEYTGSLKEFDRERLTAAISRGEAHEAIMLAFNLVFP